MRTSRGVFVFALLVTVALAGCMRGMQCGRSASAFGDAATSAVVTSIVAIIIASILGTIFAQFMGTSVMRSGEPVISVQDQSQLNQALENISADFKRLVAEDASPLSTLTSRVGPEGSDQSNAYGVYHVATNHRISFVANTEVADTSGNVQRITLLYKGYRLTALFTK